MEDKTQLQNLLSETQEHLSDAEHKLHNTKDELEKQMQLRKQEAEEWQTISIGSANDRARCQWF